MLDVNNLTAQEMMLNYTTNKNIVIEARESCRVPVPVERCPLFRRDQQIDNDNEMSKFCSLKLYKFRKILHISELMLIFNFQTIMCAKVMLT